MLPGEGSCYGCLKAKKIMNVSVVSSDLTLLQVLLILVVFPPVLEAAPANPLNCNLAKQYILTVDGKPFACMDCPDCLLGEEPPVPCGSTIDDSISNKCKPCNLGKTYSSERGYKSCQDCNSTKCLEHEVINGTCVLKSDTTVCSGVCMDRYRMNDNKTKCTKNVEPTTAPDPEEYSSKPTELSTKKQTSNNPTKLKTSEQMLPSGKYFTKIKPTMETKGLTTQPTQHPVTHGPRSYKMPVGIQVVIACLCTLVVAIVGTIVIVKCTAKARSSCNNEVHLHCCPNHDQESSETSSTSQRIDNDELVVHLTDRNETNHEENETLLHTNNVLSFLCDPDSTDPAQSGPSNQDQSRQDYDLLTNLHGQEENQETTSPPVTSSFTDPSQSSSSKQDQFRQDDLVVNLHGQEQGQVNSPAMPEQARPNNDDPTHLDNLLFGTYDDICETLNSGPPGRNWKTLATKLDITVKMADRFKAQENISDAMIRYWMSVHGNNVPKLIEHLNAIGMTDLTSRIHA